MDTVQWCDTYSRKGERVIAVHLGNDKLFEQAEEGMPMCKALDEWMKEEREIGRAEGKTEERHQTMQKMLQAGLEESLIMSILNCTKEEIVLAAAGR